MTSKYHQNVSKNRDFYLRVELGVVADDLPSAPKPLITPIFPEFSRFFPVFPGTSGRVLWIPGVQTLKMGEKWGKTGKKWVKNEVTGVEKTALMHASAHLACNALPNQRAQALTVFVVA